MHSLLHYKFLGEQVEMIYIDPPWREAADAEETSSTLSPASVQS
jgi:hypothetical protein